MFGVRVVGSKHLYKCLLHLLCAQLHNVFTCNSGQAASWSGISLRLVSSVGLAWHGVRHISALSRSGSTPGKTAPSTCRQLNVLIATGQPVQNTHSGFKWLLALQIVQAHLICPLRCRVLQLSKDQVRSFNLCVASSTSAKTNEISSWRRQRNLFLLADPCKQGKP